MASHQKQQTKKGVVLGTILPVLFSPIVAFILYSYKIPEAGDGSLMTFWEFYDEMFTSQVRLPIFISLCALANRPGFFIFMNKKTDWIGKGMIYSTLGYRWCT